MDYILEVKDLEKKYKDFTLDKISFSIPSGTIVGLIGENGAGKSTTINAILNLIKKDGGEIKVLGKEMTDSDTRMRNEIGVVFDGNNFYDTLTPRKIGNIMAKVYSNWDMSCFEDYLKRFQLPVSKEIKQFSKGMKMKFTIAVALSHNPRLLILDEATSGLDPIVRDEVLDIFLDFVQDETHAVLVSSHITSDLEKIADYITFIHKGKLIFSLSKDELIYNYGIIKCGREQFMKMESDDIITYRKKDYEYEILVSDKTRMERKYKNCLMNDVTIDDIMLLYVKGEKV
ncbi:MAG: ABC transporter ATP-binding protein [Clostridiales bacterium]|nr:ABC transporter ATP-binding protein [Clostridiales bacterium]MDU3239353.1 ABC transporter ATP-binding protein [Clostridiales bacterium]